MRKDLFVLLILAMVSTLMATGEESESPGSYDEVKSSTYKVVTSKYKTKLLKERRVSITVSGNGIEAEYSVPYSVYGLNIIATNQVLLVRNRDEMESFILYSDTPSVLIEIFNERCFKIIFQTDGSKTKEGMSTRDCESTLQKVAMVEKRENNFYKEAKRKTKLAFQKMFPPEFFEALKTNKPVDDEYSPGWNTWG